MRTTWLVVVGWSSLALASSASAQVCPSGRVEAAPGHCCVIGDRYQPETGLCASSAPGAPAYAAVFPVGGPTSAPPPGYLTTPSGYTSSAYTSDAPSSGRRGGHPIWGLFVPTFSLFAAAWIATPIVTATIAHGSHAATDIGVNAVPWAGPWICFAACGNPSPYAWALVTSGLSQLVMTVLWIVALAVHVGGDDDTALLDVDGVRLTPWASTQGGGLALELDL